MSTALQSTRTLLLSQSYEPLKAISWQRALTLLTKGKIEVLEEYDGFIHSSTIVIKIPAVVRLLTAFRRKRKPVRFSRVNIYARDSYTCQYCGDKKKVAELTFDHVIPRAQGGKTTWTNIATSCQSCNLKKGGRTPDQAKMHLKKQPEQPRWEAAVTITISNSSLPDAWRDYLYWTMPLSED